MIDDSNPAVGVSPSDSGDSDLFVIRFYDIDDPDNSKDDPIVEREYGLTDGQLSEFASEVDDRVDIDVSKSNPTIAALLLERETLYGILNGIV
jgi:hypothetical protein